MNMGHVEPPGYDGKLYKGNYDIVASMIFEMKSITYISMELLTPYARYHG